MALILFATVIIFDLHFSHRIAWILCYCKHPVDSSTSTLRKRVNLAINQARKDSIHTKNAAVITASLISKHKQSNTCIPVIRGGIFSYSDSFFCGRPAKEEEKVQCPASQDNWFTGHSTGSMLWMSWLTEINSKSNVVTFRTTALHDCNNSRKTPLKRRWNLFKQLWSSSRKTSKPSKCPIKSIPLVTTCHKRLALNIFQKLMRALLEERIGQTTRPKVLLTPLQFGLGVQLYHHYASRFLIDSLHHDRFCCSYKQATNFMSKPRCFIHIQFPCRMW